MPRESDIHPHVPSERADLFTAGDGGSTELEYLELLKALIRVTKPTNLLETGGFLGHGTRAICEAIRANGLGQLTTLECSQQYFDRTNEHTKDFEPERVIVLTDSVQYLSNWKGKPFDFAFLDSHLPTRADELRILVERELLSPNALVEIHDTSRVREMPAGHRDFESIQFWMRFNKLAADIGDRFDCIEFPLSRGLLLIQFI